MEKRVLTYTKAKWKRVQRVGSMKAFAWRAVIVLFPVLSAIGNPIGRPAQAQDSIVQASQSTEPLVQPSSSSQSITSIIPSSGYAPHPEKPLPQYSTEVPLPVAAWDGKHQRLFTLTFDAHESRSELWDSRTGWLIEYNRSGIQQSSHRLEFDSFEPQRMDIHPSSGELMFWDEGMGSVHSISGLALDGRGVSILRQDLADGLIRVDNSFPHRNMYDHAAVLSPYNIITYGGYGNWFYKQLLIYLDEASSEWLLVPQTGESIPPRGSRAQLFQYPFIGYEASETDLLTVGEVPLWLIHPLINDQGEPELDVSFQQFSDREWLEPTKIELPNTAQNLAECMESFSASVVHKQPGTYRLDPNRSIFAVYNHCGEIVFLHPETRTAYPYQPTQDSYSDDYHYSQAFYDPTIDDWIIFHFHLDSVNIPMTLQGDSGNQVRSANSASQVILTPRPVSSQQFTADEIAKLTLAGPSITPNASPRGIIILAGVSTIILFAAVFLVRRRQRRPFTFKRVNGHIKILKGLRPVNEVHRQDLVALFTIILRKYPFQRDQLSWSIQDFDQALGYHELSPSIRNTKRHELLEHFNQLIGRLIDRPNVQILEQHPDPQDRRKKIITLHTKSFPQVTTQGFTQSVM